jgi:hypothetical protein
MKHSSRKNANAAFYVDYRIGGLQIKNKVTYTYNKSTDVPFNSFSDYSHLLPYMRLYDENGDYVRRLEKFDGASGTQVNPLYEINFYNSFDHSGYDEVTDDLSLNWRITDGLRLRGQFSVLMRNSTGDLYKDPASASYSASTGNINGEKNRIHTKENSDRRKPVTHVQQYLQGTQSQYLLVLQHETNAEHCFRNTLPGISGWRPCLFKLCGRSIRKAQQLR